ncbi:AMIN domain-containing protein [Acidobacteriota bacterium]
MSDRKFQFRLILFLTLTFTVSALSSAYSYPIQAAAQKELLDITTERRNSTLIITLHLNRESQFGYFKMTDPNRLVIDLHGTVDRSAPRSIQSVERELDTIRTGMFKINTARVVLDFSGEMTPYVIEEDAEKIAIYLSLTQAEEPKIQPPPITAPVKQPDNVLDPGIQDKDQAQREEREAELQKIRDLERDIKATAFSLERQLNEARAILDESIQILEQIQEEKAAEKKKMVRFEALASIFFPSTGRLKEVYDKGLMEGAELNIGIWNAVEMWISIKNFYKISPLNEAGEDYRFNLVPLEMGLKFRFTRGIYNPYLGIGAGINFFKEILPTGEVTGSRIGLVGQAGLFIKFAKSLVFDLYMHYRYARTDETLNEININGISLGAGFGFEF